MDDVNPSICTIFFSLLLFTCFYYNQDPELEKLHADRIAALKVCNWTLK